MAGARKDSRDNDEKDEEKDEAASGDLLKRDRAEKQAMSTHHLAKLFKKKQSSRPVSPHTESAPSAPDAALVIDNDRQRQKHDAASSPGQHYANPADFKDNAQEVKPTEAASPSAQKISDIYTGKYDIIALLRDVENRKAFIAQYEDLMSGRHQPYDPALAASTERLRVTPAHTITDDEIGNFLDRVLTDDEIGDFLDRVWKILDSLIKTDSRLITDDRFKRFSDSFSYTNVDNAYAIIIDARKFETGENRMPQIGDWLARGSASADMLSISFINNKYQTTHRRFALVNGHWELAKGNNKDAIDPKLLNESTPATLIKADAAGKAQYLEFLVAAKAEIASTIGKSQPLRQVTPSSVHAKEMDHAQKLEKEEREKAEAVANQKRNKNSSKTYSAYQGAEALKGINKPVEKSEERHSETRSSKFGRSGSR